MDVRGALGAEEHVTARAESAARRILRGIEPRLSHVLAVGRKAEKVPLSRSQANWLVAAAYLHDIGYAPALRETGLHQIDGARWLASKGHAALACMVAHHTCADVELELRGLAHLLDPFPRPPDVLSEALAYCDITTGPTGVNMTVEERIVEVGHRRGFGSTAHRALRFAQPNLERAVINTGRLV